MGYRLEERVRVATLSEWVNGIPHNLVGDEEISGVCDFSRSEPDCLCAYVKGPLPAHKPGMVFIAQTALPGVPCLVVPQVQHAMNEIVARLIEEIGFRSCLTHPGIHPSAQIGQHVVIEEDVEIGAGCVIEHHAVIHSGTRMGKNCLVRTHASIGGQGFSYFRDTDGELHKQVAVGGVHMGDDVEIGAGSCIVRGNVFDTTLENGVKIDNLVYVAHDCKIGKESFVIAGASLCGYVKVGARSRIAPNASVRQLIKIGDEAIVGLGAVVVDDVESGWTVAGVPARRLGLNSEREVA